MTAQPAPAPHRLRRVLAHPAVLYLGGAAILAVSWFDPRYAALAWIAMVFEVLAILRTRRVLGVFFGSWAFSTLSGITACVWVREMNVIVLRQTMAEATGTWIAQGLAVSLSTSVLVALGFALSKGLRRFNISVPLLVWFPLAWTAGEQISARIFVISNQAWLTTQWTVQPILRTLGHLGWWATVCGCLIVCAGAAHAIHERRARWLFTAVLLLPMWLMPALPEVGHAQLEGIAAVHLRDSTVVPRHEPKDRDLDLLLWPEDTYHLRPFYAEGGTPGARIRRLIGGGTTPHLIGLITNGRHAGLQNQIVQADADGTLGYGRAKKILLPLGEAAFLGFGTDHVRRGSLSTAMDVAGRRAIVLICGELFSRPLLAEGVDDGGTVLLVAARDHIFTSERALRHMLAVQVLRSVEFRVPSIRASLGGNAVFVSTAGRVLAQSRQPNGYLTWDEDSGTRRYDFRGRPADNDRPADVTRPSTTVLYSRTARRFRTACPEGECTHVALEDFECPTDPKAQTRNVIVAGHGLPPHWLSHPASHIAAAVRCFKPDVVVIDTCLGASSELLRALGDLPARVVAATTLVPTAGFRYASAFFSEAGSADRAAAVDVAGGRVVRWVIDPDELAAAERRVAEMDNAARRAALVRQRPPLVAVPLGTDAQVLVALDKRPTGLTRRHRRRVGARRRTPVISPTGDGAPRRKARRR